MRADLLALTPESVASLANLGLVKRAQRDFAAGDGPAIAEDEKGVVTGTFKDGAVAKLVPGISLRDAQCTCPATTVCRHRVATALAYRAWYEANAEAAATESRRAEALAASGAAGAAAPWSPGVFDDDALLAHVGKRAMERARAAVRAGIVVELEPSATPTARLPTCAVRFLVPNDLAYARCDCAIAAACEHVVVAAWAFREAGPEDAVSRPRTIELRREGAAGAVDLSALDEASHVTRDVLVEGVAALDAQFAQRFARARDRLTKAGMIWPSTIVDDLEIAVDAYRARSARYSSANVAWLVSELEARRRACLAACELPQRFLLGSDEARETLLDHVRLVSLGARVDADGRSRDGEIYLADPDTGMVLVLAKRWTFGEHEEPEDGPSLAKRTIAPRVPFGTLARGQLVSRAVKRSANHGVTLGTSRTGQTSLTPQSGDWSMMPASILVRDLADYANDVAKQPPRLLRPRVLASTLRVVEVGEVGPIMYEPAEQRLMIHVAAKEGEGSLRIVRRHHRGGPFALDAIAAAFKRGGVRFVAGDMRRGYGGLEMDPTAIVADRVIVPDLEGAEDAKGALDGVDHVSVAIAHAATPATALELASSVLEEGCHTGLVRLRADWTQRARGAVDRMEEVGLGRAAKRLAVLVDRVRAMADGSEASVDAAVSAWKDAALRVALTREALA